MRDCFLDLFAVRLANPKSVTIAGLLNFQPGTNGGLVSGNTFQMGCCAFVGYAANGVLLEANNFTDFADSAQPDGNGFASFGSPRVSSKTLMISLG